MRLWVAWKTWLNTSMKCKEYTKNTVPFSIICIGSISEVIPLCMNSILAICCIMVVLNGWTFPTFWAKSKKDWNYMPCASSLGKYSGYVFDKCTMLTFSILHFRTAVVFLCKERLRSKRKQLLVCIPYRWLYFRCMLVHSIVFLEVYNNTERLKWAKKIVDFLMHFSLPCTCKIHTTEMQLLVTIILLWACIQPAGDFALIHKGRKCNGIWYLWSFLLPYLQCINLVSITLIALYSLRKHGQKMY